MEKWNTELTVGQNVLGTVKIRLGIFQGDILSPLLFVLAMVPLALILRKTFYETKKGGGKINHLMFMDDIKLFAKNEHQVDSLINTVRVFSDDIKMEFGLSKCSVLTMKRGKLVKSEGIPVPNGQVMTNIEDSGYKYLGILEADEVKDEAMKDQTKKEYIKKVRKILKSKLNGRNVISAINSRAVAVVRYGAGIIKWTKLELEELDRKTRKLTTIYGAYHPKGDVDRLYMNRSLGGRGLIGVEDWIGVELDSVERYLEVAEEKLLKEAHQNEIVENRKNRKTKDEVKTDHEERYKGEGLHGKFWK